MSLNDSPVNIQAISLIHQKLREFLNEDKLFKKVPEGNERHHMREEYWVLKDQNPPWIFLTISDLFNPSTNTFAVHVSLAIHPDLFENERYKKVREKMFPDENSHNYPDQRLLNSVSSFLSRYALSIGIDAKDKDQVTEIVDDVKIKMRKHAIELRYMKQKEIKEGLTEMFEKYLKNF